MELDNDDIFACIFKVTIFILLRVEFFFMCEVFIMLELLNVS